MVDHAAFARLPKVDVVLACESLRTHAFRRDVQKRVVQAELDQLRRRLKNEEVFDVPDAAAVAQQVRARLDAWSRPRPRRVINATGVVLHTNLGRAPLSAFAIEAMAGAAGYCDLEVDLEDGRRGSRYVWLRPLLSAVIGAQDVHVVNNNAAALLLACTVLGLPGGVALCRGQMVEIGDGFRVATMAAAGGCVVVPVGSTNRTHARDYEAALNGSLPECRGRPVSALLWVHQSNFVQQGYVSEVPLPALAELARTRGVPLIADLGSGSLGADLPAREPTITEYLEQGADLVLASGDKLLGGPQGGVIAGRGEIVERCRRHPMARALRPDKTAIAAMHATFVAHALGEAVDLPLHRMVRADLTDLQARARVMAEALGLDPEVVVSASATIGGGSLPGDTLPSAAVVIPSAHPDRIARRLRLGEPAVVGRIEHEQLLVDLRTVAPEDDAQIIDAVRAALR